MLVPLLLTILMLSCNRPRVTLVDPPLENNSHQLEDFGADTLAAIPPVTPRLLPRPQWVKPVESEVIVQRNNVSSAHGLTQGNKSAVATSATPALPEQERKRLDAEEWRAQFKAAPGWRVADPLARPPVPPRPENHFSSSADKTSTSSGSEQRVSGLRNRGITGLPVNTEIHVGTGTLANGVIDGQHVKVIHGGLHTVQGKEAFVKQLPLRLQKLVHEKVNPDNGVVQVIFPREAFDSRGWRDTEAAALLGSRGVPGGKSLYPASWNMQEISNAAHLAVKKGLVELVTTTGVMRHGFIKIKKREKLN